MVHSENGVLRGASAATGGAVIIDPHVHMQRIVAAEIFVGSKQVHANAFAARRVIGVVHRNPDSLGRFVHAVRCRWNTTRTIVKGEVHDVIPKRRIVSSVILVGVRAA